MLYYAQIYNKIISAENNPKDVISSILYRLNNIEMTVSYPFLLAMFGHELRKEITSLDVETTLKAIESYISRRIMRPPLASFNASALKLVIYMCAMTRTSLSAAGIGRAGLPVPERSGGM